MAGLQEVGAREEGVVSIQRAYHPQVLLYLIHDLCQIWQLFEDSLSKRERSQQARLSFNGHHGHAGKE